MKHIALFLALVIFALSLASCSDLTYYKGAGWSCSQSEFYATHYEPTREKIIEVAAEHGIELACGGTDVYDDCFMLVAFDKNFTSYFYFNCEELWGRIEVRYYFLGSDESDLADYDLQKKYIDFLNDIVCLFAYDMYEEENVFDAAYNLCVSEGKTSYEKEKVKDNMTGGVSYKLVLGAEESLNVNHTYRKKTGEGYYETFKCNYFYFEGLVDGGFDGVHAS